MKIYNNYEALKLKLNYNEMELLHNYVVNNMDKLQNDTALSVYQVHILYEFKIKLALVMFKIQTKQILKPVKTFKLNQLEKHTLSCLFRIADTNDGLLLTIQEQIIKGLHKTHFCAA